MRKVAVVTGASRGIGKSIAIALAKEGYDLGLCCRNSVDQLKELADELRGTYHVNVFASQGDVADAAFVEAFLQNVRDMLGPVAVLVNNAGIAHIGLLSDMSVEEWNQVISTNLSSCFYTSRQVIPDMVHNKSGRIVNISSVWGNVGASCEVAYSAAKGGMNSFTRALAKELAPSNIQVNAIACGVIDTQMNHCFSEEDRQELMDEIPTGRFGTSEEVADLVITLTKGNEYLTGQIITLDGGWV